jgi:IclR family pca regulon transcriptional regulator
MSTDVSRPTSRSLAYGLGLLRLFSAEHPVRSISELAELMQVSRPTAHRYASTCLELGYLEQTPMRRYRLARRSAELGLAMLGSLPLRRHALPVMRRLREATARTVSLAVLDGQEVLYLERLRGCGRGQYEIDQLLGAGTRARAKSTAGGMVLLADVPPHAMIDPHLLRQTPEACSLAFAVHSEPRSALELTLPSELIDRPDALAALAARLRAAARSLEAAVTEAALVEAS